MTETKQDSLIEKIKKLFALAQRKNNNDGSTNEAEASAAMAMAQQLLTKYNLDVKTIQDSEKKDSAATASGPREKRQVKRSAMYRWQQTFWGRLAKVNYCFHWTVEVTEPRKDNPYRKVKRHVVLGSEANVAVVTVMGEYLTETIERLLPYDNREALSNSAISWREGCAERLIQRVEENCRKMKENGFDVEGAQCTALAVQDLYEKEYAANYDFQYGAGAYASMQARHVRWAQEDKERRAKAEEERKRMLAGETPAQRTQREREESRAAAKQAAKDAKYWERARNRRPRQERQRDLVAYAKGFKKADDINLSSPLKEKKNGGLL